MSSEAIHAAAELLKELSRLEADHRLSGPSWMKLAEREAFYESRFSSLRKAHDALEAVASGPDSPGLLRYLLNTAWWVLAIVAETSHGHGRPAWEQMKPPGWAVDVLPALAAAAETSEPGWLEYNPGVFLARVAELLDAFTWPSFDELRRELDSAARTAERTEKPQRPGIGDEDLGPLSPVAWGELRGFPATAAKKRFQRWRQANKFHDGIVQVASPRPGEPHFLYTKTAADLVLDRGCLSRPCPADRNS